MSNVNEPDSSHLSYPDFMAVLDDYEGESDELTGFIAFYIADLIAWLVAPAANCTAEAKAVLDMENFSDAGNLHTAVPYPGAYNVSGHQWITHASEDGSAFRTVCVFCDKRWK